MEAVYFARCVARSSLVRDDGTASKSLLHQASDTFADVFFLNGDPCFRYASQGASVRIDSSRIDEDCENEGDDVGTGYEEDIGQSVGDIALDNSVDGRKENQAEEEDSEEKEERRIKEALYYGGHD